MEKILINEINTLINEELGINDEIKAQTEILYSTLKEYLASIKSNTFSNGIGSKKVNFIFKVTFKKISFNIHVDVTYLNFKDRQYYEEYLKKNNIENNGESSFRQIGKKIFSMMNLNFYGISGDMSSVKELVHHELTHIYQQFQMNHSFNDNFHYSDAASNLYNENEKEKIIAWLMYMSANEEQDAAISGAYSFFEENYNDNDEINKVLYQTVAYQWLLKYKEYISFIDKNTNDDELKNAISKYFVNVNTFHNYIKKSYHRLKLKFAKLVVKVKKDFIWENVVPRGISNGKYHLNYFMYKLY